MGQKPVKKWGDLGAVDGSGVLNARWQPCPPSFRTPRHLAWQHHMNSKAMISLRRWRHCSFSSRRLLLVSNLSVYMRQKPLTLKCGAACSIRICTIAKTFAVHFLSAGIASSTFHGSLSFRSFPLEQLKKETYN
eukprot:440854-Amphidinium_carterae.1